MLVILSVLSLPARAAEGMKLTVMTYNVAYGAGVDPTEQQIVERDTNGKVAGNRLDRVISVIRHVNPDIVGIQEACSWDKNDEAVAKQVAGELGMHFYLAKSGRSRFNVALFSRLPIIWARGYPDDFSRAALQAQLKLPDGRTLHVFNAHFNLLRNMEGQLGEIRCLARLMRLRSSGLSVMMGDANFKYGIHKESTEALLASRFVMAPPVGERIDQIWTSARLAGDIREGEMIPAELTNGTSDHRPTVMVIGIPLVK